jgi:long-chain acyl-CoA synthetase
MSDLHKTILDGKTIPGFFKDRFLQKPANVAFRYKDRGRYKEITWKKYFWEVAFLCKGLLEEGLQAGDRIAIMGDPCPEWFYADLAAQSAGAISFGIYSTSSPEETRYSIERTRAKFFIAENQEYVDKILPYADEFSFLTAIIVIDTRGTFLYNHPKLKTYEDIRKIGEKDRELSISSLSAMIPKVISDNPAFLVFTSGTTGMPKPAVISHKGILLTLVYALSEIFPGVVEDHNRVISHLSLAHIIERAFSIYIPLVYDWVPHMGEGIEYLQETLFEVQPTFFHGVPRIYEKISGQLMVGIQNSSWIKRKIFDWAMKIGWRNRKQHWDGIKPSKGSQLLYWLAYQVCFRHILHRTGLRKTTYAIATGAPFPPKIQQLWQVWGLDLVNLYGSTETSGIISSQPPGYPKPGDLGKPISINQVRLAEDGELLIEGPGVFKGYFQDEEKTKETIIEGVLYMGEVFKLTENDELVMIDRKKDIQITSGGKNLSPTYIESAIKASPYISEVIVFAEGRKFPSALIELDFTTVSEWARKNKVLYSGFTSLTEHPEVIKKISAEIQKGNQTLARVEQVKKFRIIPQELDPESGETTPTRKIKRGLIYEMFGHLVEEMYED